MKQSIQVGTLSKVGEVQSRLSGLLLSKQLMLWVAVLACQIVLTTSVVQAQEKKAKAVAQASKKLPKVTVLATGGTIAGTAATSDQLTGYKAGVLTADQLLSAVPDIKKFAEISAEQIANVDSSQMNVEIWLKLAKRINELLAGDVDGIVVTHGTDTMEETAYFLNLVVKSHKPVVVVGSMRPSTAISADGPLNLMEAVILAASPDAVGQGVMVALNGTINGARDVTKTNTVQVDTFRSVDLGYLGYIIQDKAFFYKSSSRKHTLDTEFDISKLESLPKVEIVYSYVNAGDDAVKGIVAGNPAGIVSGGVGDGLIYGAVEKILIDAAKTGVVVVRSARVGTGITTREADDATKQFVAADNLNPQKARVLLMLALTLTKDPDAIQKMFQTY